MLHIRREGCWFSPGLRCGTWIVTSRVETVYHFENCLRTHTCHSGDVAPPATYMTEVADRIIAQLHHQQSLLGTQLTSDRPHSGVLSWHRFKRWCMFPQIGPHLALGFQADFEGRIIAAADHRGD